MNYRFFAIPVQPSEEAQDEMNRFIESHRVLAVDREFVTDGRRSLWCFCITYRGTKSSGSGAGVGKSHKDTIDYREVLNKADFSVYARLRALRKNLAERDGVPAYAALPGGISHHG